MESNNPIFSSFEQSGEVVNRATLNGVTAKTAFLLILTIASAIGGLIFFSNNPTLLFPMLIISSIVGLIAIIMGRISPSKAMVGGIIYAICEGLFLGVISYLFESIVPGVVMVAMLATLAIFGTMLLLYSTKIVQATPMLYKVMGAAGVAILLLYLGMFFFSLFGLMTVNIYDPLYAILSIALIAYGSFMLVLNFEEAKSYVDNGLDKKYEWVASLGLIITILYIYVQVLKFTAIIMSRRD